MGSSPALVKDHLLRRSAGQHPRDLVLEPFLSIQVSILLRQGHGITQAHSTGYDGDLVDGIAIGKIGLHDSMPRFVVGQDLLLVFGDQPAPALRTGDDPFHRLFTVLHTDGLLVAPGGEDGCLVHQVLNVCPDKTRRLASQNIQVHIPGQRLAPHMDFQDSMASLDVRSIEDHAAVKTPRS